MKFHYGGMYRSEADFKVEPKHVEGEVPFKEPGHTKFAIVANLGCIALFALLIYFVYHMEGIDAKKFFGGLRGGALIALVLQSIPGLENCNIVRYGVMHRNTFINSPTLLNPTLQTRQRKDLFS